MSEHRPRVALLVKRSKYDRFIERGDRRLSELFSRDDPTVANLRAAHGEHLETVEEVQQVLSDSAVEVTRLRGWRNGFATDGFDLVVTVGGDGTLLIASHSVSKVPLLAINSAPSYSVGFFCCARKGEIERTLNDALRGRLKRALLTRMQVKINGEVRSTRVLNDALFCHMSPAATSRYILEFGDCIEEQTSSGFWVGPAAGSTAAQRSAGGEVIPLASKNLQLVVREPYSPRGRTYRMRRLVVKSGQVVRARSKSHKLRLYLDGVDHICLEHGDLVEFTQSPEPLTLLGISLRRKWDEPQL